MPPALWPAKPIQILGTTVLGAMGVLFHFLDYPKDAKLLFPSMDWLRKLNERIATGINSSWEFFGFRIKTSAWGVARWECVGFGFTCMQIGEWLAAIAFWTTMAAIGIGVGIASRIKRERSVFALIMSVVGWCALAILLVTITIERKPDSEPWSNMQKLWLKKHEPMIGIAWSVRIPSTATNRAFPIWALDHNAVREGYFCRIQNLAEVYVTNEQDRTTAIANMRVEVEQPDGHWESVRIVNTSSLLPLYYGQDMRHVSEWDAIDGKYFDGDVFGKNISSGETANGWLLLTNDPNQDMTGKWRFLITDLHGGPYMVMANTDKLPLQNGGFRMSQKIVDLSKLTSEDCPTFSGDGW